MSDYNEPVFHRDRISQLPEPYINTIDSIMDIVFSLREIVMVILFGSCSRGAPNEKSDIDLLLLLDSKNMPFSQLEHNIGTVIYENYNSNNRKPIDFLFADKEVFDNSSNSSSVYKIIKKEGVIRQKILRRIPLVDNLRNGFSNFYLYVLSFFKICCIV